MREGIAVGFEGVDWLWFWTGIGGDGIKRKLEVSRKTALGPEEECSRKCRVSDPTWMCLFRSSGLRGEEGSGLLWLWRSGKASWQRWDNGTSEVGEIWLDEEGAKERLLDEEFKKLKTCLEAQDG